MLRSLAIRDFVTVAVLDADFDDGFTVLTGETGAGKSILLDALGLLLGDRFDAGQIRAGAERAELAATFDIGDVPTAAVWLTDQALAADGGEVLLRRVLDAQGRSRAWINGRPVTLAQLKALGEMLVALHGQHAHQTLGQPEAQRALLDAFGGFTILATEVAERWRAWRRAVEQRDAARSAAAATASEREFLEERRRELAGLEVSEAEWRELAASQSRLAHAAELLGLAGEGVAVLADADDSLTTRLAQLVARLRAAVSHDPALSAVVALLEPAQIELAEAARALRDYERHLDLDPAELVRVEARLAVLHEIARKHRTKPDALPALLAETEARLATLHASADAEALAVRVAKAEDDYRDAAKQLSGKRRFHGNELAHRVSNALQALAMAGGRFEVVMNPTGNPTSHGLDDVEFAVTAHAQQPLGALAKVASGGELSRIALALSVVASEAGAVPTLVFDEVDSGIGGGVAATVGQLLQTLGATRQVLCVTHLPQVAACADTHYRVAKVEADGGVTSELAVLAAGQRVEELARMLGGAEITARTRAHAKELLAQQRRPPDLR